MGKVVFAVVFAAFASWMTLCTFAYLAWVLWVAPADYATHDVRQIIYGMSSVFGVLVGLITWRLWIAVGREWRVYRG
jgi:hypothetical protein